MHAPLADILLSPGRPLQQHVRLQKGLGRSGSQWDNRAAVGNCESVIVALHTLDDTVWPLQ
jgi:hypothetical protein